MKLTNSQIEKKTALVDRAGKARTVLADAIQAYNDALSEAYGNLKIALDEYESERERIASDVEEIASDLRGKWDNKSEKWQESDKGQSAATFVEEWENVSLDEFEVDEPDEINEPDDMGEIIDALAEESDE
jgi:arginyl-tRNA synthetase